MTDEEEPAAPPQTGAKIRAVGIIVLMVGLLSLFTALFMNNNSGQPIAQTLPPLGGTIGPYDFDANTVLDVEVHQTLQKEGWSFVSGELLNADEETLFGFGDELWWETGVDSEGYSWNESVRMYDLKITVPESGQFYFDFAVESGLKAGARSAPGAAGAAPSPETYLSQMTVKITKKAGSALPHLVFGIFALLGGIVVTAIGNARSQRENLVASLA